MEGSTAAPPQRVCPKCARISWATGPKCPYCTARFRSGRGIAPWMLALTALIVLLGVAAMLVIAGQIAQDRLDDRVADVNREFDRSLNQFRADVRKELNARLPATGGVPVPTVTPPPTTTPPPTETPSGDATETPTASPTESPSPSPTETITP
jgi:hypothetical protein